MSIGVKVRERLGLLAAAVNRTRVAGCGWAVRFGHVVSPCYQQVLRQSSRHRQFTEKDIVCHATRRRVYNEKSEGFCLKLIGQIALPESPVKFIQNQIKCEAR